VWGHHLLHAARGDALDRLCRHDEAGTAFERAMTLTSNTAEIDLLRRRRGGYDPSPLRREAPVNGGAVSEVSG